MFLPQRFTLNFPPIAASTPALSRWYGRTAHARTPPVLEGFTLMSAALILMETARHVAWMPPDGSLRGPIVDRLMYWNLIAIIVAAVIAHLWLIVALLRRRSSARKFSSPVR